MKKTNIFTLGLAGMALAAGLAACQADMDTPELESPVASLTPNTTIAELKTIFENKTELVGMKDEAAKTPYVIHGRVISSDATGNIYKNLVIQDETAALTFSINQSSMYVDYRLGQDVVVDMTGLYMGYYRGLQQVGAPGDPYNGEPQLGFMAYDYWLAHAEKNGLPDTDVTNTTMSSDWPQDNMYCIAMTLPISTGNLIKTQSQLVELKNVYFRQGGDVAYAPKEESVSRYLYNENGDSIAVRNSGYSNFYNQILPKGKGSVRGILSYYGDSWQLLLRGPEDVMIDDKGSEEKPFTIEEALSPQFSGRSGWVEGYIVGSVMAGVDDVTVNADAIFGPEAELDNNILIAADPDCTDVTKCVVLQLPQKTQLRRYANLVDNPGVYKKKIDVDGLIGEYMGITGIVDPKGVPGTFKIEGVDIKIPEGEFKQVYKGLLTSDTSCDFTFDNITLGQGMSYVWSWKSYKDSHYLNGSGYLGSAREALAYAISPVIDLSDKAEAKCSFRHAARYQTTLKKLCGICVREAGATEWNELEIPVWPAAGDWTFVNSGDIDLTYYTGKKIEIAFKYGSDSSGADTWEINDLTVLAR